MRAQPGFSCGDLKSAEKLANRRSLFDGFYESGDVAKLPVASVLSYHAGYQGANPSAALGDLLLGSSRKLS
jgi:hypothetical protein